MATTKKSKKAPEVQVKGLSKEGLRTRIGMIEMIATLLVLLKQEITKGTKIDYCYTIKFPTYYNNYSVTDISKEIKSLQEIAANLRVVLTDKTGKEEE